MFYYKYLDRSSAKLYSVSRSHKIKHFVRSMVSDTMVDGSSAAPAPVMRPETELDKLDGESTVLESKLNFVSEEKAKADAKAKED